MTHHLWIAPLVALALAQLAAIATSIYLHRALAHRALVLHPVTDVCFRTMLWLTTGQKRREWVAVHRKHHTFTDQVGDPHSPRLFGFWRIQFLNVYYYVREARNPATIRTFAPDIMAPASTAAESRRRPWSGPDGCTCAVTCHDMRRASNGVASGEDGGYLKLVFDGSTQRLLGAQMVSYAAAELVQL